MTKLAVVAYPLLGDVDRQWIDSTRIKHDPQVRLIAAHFTLVFPVDFDADAATAHVRSVVGAAAPISFVIKHARAVRDQPGAGGHVFLVPDDGYPELVALHDRLYDGPFRQYLRREVPYVPHITVAAHAVFERCVAIAQELLADARFPEGRIESIELIRVEADAVRCIASLSLGAID
ncbi:MAG: hypothetical protein DMF82_06935 [Acidobacteria bacterium]|nr:MAG: hypothetical protein DMF82_06935 [Acidobacteriota bacterium]